jgi:hypothetical protein
MFGNGLHYLVPLGHPTLLKMDAHHENQQKKIFLENNGHKTKLKG